MKNYCNFTWPNGKKCVILHLEYYYRIIKTQTENMVEISDKPKKPDNFLVWSILSTILCLSVGMYWMALLYLAYATSAIYGWYHWTRRGAYLN